MYMVATDIQPLNIVENKGFIKFCKTAVPLYKLPSRKTFTKMMDNKYEVVSQVVKVKFKAFDQCTMTADVWTDTSNVKSYLGMTVHYVEGSSMRSVALSVVPLDDSHTAVYLVKQMEEIRIEWNIEKSKVMILLFPTTVE